MVYNPYAFRRYGHDCILSLMRQPTDRSKLDIIIELIVRSITLFLLGYFLGNGCSFSMSGLFGR